MLRNRQKLPLRLAGSFVAIAAAATLALSSPAAAQDRCYRVIDLGDIGADPDAGVGFPGSTEPFAINNSQQVVFNVEDEVSSEKRAYLYLQTPAFGLVAGRHNLHALAGFALEEDSGVHDINDAGLAVGWATFSGVQHAVVWRINEHSEGSIPFHDLGLLDLVKSSYSAAFAINDEDPPIIVGEGDVEASCNCDEPTNSTVARGYWVAFTFPPPLLFADAIRLVHDNDLGCKPITTAADVNSAVPPSSPTIAAGISEDGASPCFEDPFARGTVWTNGAAVGVDLQSSDPPKWRARGVSDSGAVTGSSLSPSSALYWHTTTAAPLDIGNGLTGGSNARRINNNDPPSVADPLQVAGWHNLINPKAVLWECDGDCDQLSNWSATELNDTIQHCSNTWSIRRAYDVNDNGWIISVGTFAGEKHAVLLRPLENCCDTDLDGNGTVGASDLLSLLVSWGPCDPPPLPCDADLDCDGSVGAADLLILLTDWGADCNNGVTVGGGPVPRDVQDCIDRFCCDEEDLLAFENCICLVDPECDITP